MNFKKIENICAIAIIVAFFLPWLSLGFISFSGYDLPNLASSVSQFGAAFSEDSSASSSGSNAWLVYLVPLLAVAALGFEYLEKNSKNLFLASGVVNLIGFIYALVEVEGEIGSFGVGLWLTILASVVMLLATFGVIKQTNSS